MRPTSKNKKIISWSDSVDFIIFTINSSPISIYYFYLSTPKDNLFMSTYLLGERNFGMIWSIYNYKKK